MIGDRMLRSKSQELMECDMLERKLKSILKKYGLWESVVKILLSGA